MLMPQVSHSRKMNVALALVLARPGLPLAEEETGLLATLVYGKR